MDGEKEMLKMYYDNGTLKSLEKDGKQVTLMQLSMDGYGLPTVGDLRKKYNIEHIEINN